jgi:hypothetical protein
MRAIAILVYSSRIMTRFLYDQFAKDYLKKFLLPFGAPESSFIVAGEVREIDVFFVPAPQPTGNPQILGLLGRFAAKAALFEPFRNPVTKKTGIKPRPSRTAFYFI